MNRNHWGLNVWLVLGMLFLYFPLVVLIIFSFNRSQLVEVWGGWSTHWYGVLIHDQSLLSAAWLSLRIGVSASFLGVALGTLCAMVLKRYGYFRGRTFFYSMTLTPIVMPDVIIGLALLLLFVSLGKWIGIPRHYGFGTILIAHTTFCAAYATVIIQARIGALDRSIEEAAQDLGAKPTKTFFWITLPQLIPSLIAAWLLCFTLSIDDVVITSFVTGPGSTTLPLYIFSTVKTGVTPEINALATILIAIVGFCLLIATVASFKAKKRPKKSLPTHGKLSQSKS